MIHLDIFVYELKNVLLLLCESVLHDSWVRLAHITMHMQYSVHLYTMSRK
ncbi:hypothetical protein ES703_01494 [subsurface metagenome]